MEMLDVYTQVFEGGKKQTRLGIAKKVCHFCFFSVMKSLERNRKKKNVGLNREKIDSAPVVCTITRTHKK